MPRATHTQTSFTAGELSPKLMGRTDLDRYQNGLKTASNALIYPHGMVSRRPGTKFISYVKGNGTARLVPFEYNDDESYVIEIGDEYLRFYRDGIQIQTALSVTGVSTTATTTTYTTSISHRLAVNDYVTVTGVIPSELNQAGYITAVTSSTFTLATPDLTAHSYTSSGSAEAPYDVASPWDDTEVGDLSFTQSADVLYAFHPNYVPRQIARTGADVFSVTSLAFRDGPVGLVSQTAYIRIGAQGHNATLIDSSYRTGLGVNSATGIQPGEHLYIQIYDEDYTFDHDGVNGTTGKDIGRIIKYKDSSLSGYTTCVIYQTLSPKTAYAMYLSVASGHATSFYYVNPKTVDGDEWYIGEFYGAVNDDTHRLSLVSGTPSYSDPNLTVTTDRSHVLIVGDEVALEGIETTGDDVNGTYSVTGRTDTTITMNIGSKSPGTFTADTGTVTSTEAFMNNFAQEGNAQMNQPSLGAFYQQRLWLGNTNNAVNKIYGSEASDFTRFRDQEFDNGDVLDTNAVSYAIDDDQVNAIRWMKGVASGLVVGTNGAEYSVTGSSTGDIISPTSIQARRQTQFGSIENVSPELISRSVLFAHRSGKKLMELSYSFEADQQVATDMSIVSEHILKDGITDMSFQEMPIGLLWMILGSGDLACFTFEKDQEVLGWSTCSFGSSSDSVESICTIPESDGDGTWMVVSRGSNKFIELLQDPYDIGDRQELAWYVDAGLSIDNRNTVSSAQLTFTADSTYNNGDTGTLVATGYTPFSSGDVGVFYRLYGSSGLWYDLEITSYTSSTEVDVTLRTSGFPDDLKAVATSDVARLFSTVSGLDHLEGETVQIWADGEVLNTETVSSGSITLDRRASTVIVGLGYTTRITSLPVRVLQYFTDSRGKYRSLYNCELNVWASEKGTFSFGKSSYPLPYNTREDVPGYPPYLKTQVFDITADSHYDADQMLDIVVSDPVPFNLLSVVYELDLNDTI